MNLQRLRRFEEETKLLDSALESHLRLLESVVTNANDGVVITEAKPIVGAGPRIQYVNPAFTRLTGYSPEEIIGRTPKVLQGPLTSTDALAKIRFALQNGRSAEVELINYRKDGTTYWVEISISPVSDEQRDFTHWIAVLRNVSERKANEEIAARARVAELQNEQLAAEIAERRKVESRLEHAAFHDALTGLKNRAYFLERLQQALQHCRSRSSYRASTIYLDLDGFKSINDGLGHRIGDLVLIEVSKRLERCCRPQDTLCRFGGDEFTLLLDDMHTTDDVFLVAQRILDVMSDPLEAGEGIVMTPSLGICEVDPRYSQPEDVLRDADIAMYRAKAHGGAQYIAFNEEMHSSTMAALQAKRQLRRAVQHGEFVLHYQPLIEMQTNRIIGVEALVRRLHPEQGLLSPAEFIPLAEETGLIVPLGAWVLRTACSQLRVWQDSLPELHITVSVNTSSAQLEDPSFFSQIVDVITETQVDARSLQIEVTETILLQDTERMAELFTQLRQLGIRIVLDDFGTGYSSLGYIERYPIDSLKIDKSFIHRLAKQSTKGDIVRMIIGLADGLGIKVTAEGVENQYQLDILREYGCTSVQGYFYSEPLPKDRMTMMLKEGIKSSDIW